MDTMNYFEKTMITFLVILLFVCIGGLVDAIWIHPVAENNANIECKELGFDQVKEFSRIGVFSTTPVAIKCEYAERYTDLGVRTTATS